MTNKAVYTAALVAYCWAGAVKSKRKHKKWQKMTKITKKEKKSKKNFTKKFIKNYQKLNNKLSGNGQTDRQT